MSCILYIYMGVLAGRGSGSGGSSCEFYDPLENLPSSRGFWDWVEITECRRTLQILRVRRANLNNGQKVKFRFSDFPTGFRTGFRGFRDCETFDITELRCMNNEWLNGLLTVLVELDQVYTVNGTKKTSQTFRKR